MTTAGIIVTAVLGLAGSNAAAALIKAYFDRRRITEKARRVDVDAAGVLSDVALSLLEPLRAQAAELTRQLTEAHARIRELEERLAASEHR